MASKQPTKNDNKNTGQTTLGPLELAPTPILEGPITCDAVCVDITRRETVYGPYVDFHLKPEHAELAAAVGGNAVRVGFPMRLNSESALGRLASKFALKAGPNGAVNLEDMRGTRWDVNFVKVEREAKDQDGTVSMRRFWEVEKESIRRARGA